MAQIFRKFRGVFLRILFPNHINRISSRLLTDRPRIWSSRIVYIIYYLFLLTIIVVPIAVVIPIKPHQISDIVVYEILLILLTLLVILIWGILILKFNIEKQFGETSLKTGWLEFSLYSICIALILSPILLIFTIFTIRLSFLIDYQEISIIVSNHQEFIREFSTDEITYCFELVHEIPLNAENFDFEVISTFSGEQVNSLEEAQSNYCSAYFNANSIFNLLNPEESTPLIPLIIIILTPSLGWYTFALKMIREKAQEHFLGISLILWMYLNPSLLTVILLSIFLPDLDDDGRLLILQLNLWVVTFIISLDILTLNRHKVHSRVSSVNITLFPYFLLLSSLTFGNYLTENTFFNLGYLPFIATFIIILLLIPYLKGKYLKLLTLPTDNKFSWIFKKSEIY